MVPLAHALITELSAWTREDKLDQRVYGVSHLGRDTTPAFSRELP